MLKRIASTGINLVVLGVSVGIFLIAFIALNALASAQKPPTISILTATRNLSIGDVITPNDLAIKTVFQDEDANFYINEEEVADVVGGVVAQPIFAGQAIYRSALIARASEETRLSAALAQYPGHSLFPLPLDAINIIAPDIKAFMPGDLVGVTVVMASRPQQFTTPTAVPDFIILPSETPSVMPSSEQTRQESDALLRAVPPLAKDLFPMGIRVVSVQGLPPTADEEGSTPSGFSSFDQPQMLILLIPNESREVLSLALQQGDRLVVSLMARGDESPTAGFTYWDLEDLFQADRKEALGGP